MVAALRAGYFTVKRCPLIVPAICGGPVPETGTMSIVNVPVKLFPV